MVISAACRKSFTGETVRKDGVTSASSTLAQTTALQLGDNRRDLVLKDRNCSEIHLCVALASLCRLSYVSASTCC